MADRGALPATGMNQQPRVISATGSGKGCGSQCHSSSTSASATSGTAASTQAASAPSSHTAAAKPAGKLDRVVVAQVPLMSFAALYSAIDNGFVAEQGIRPELQRMASGTGTVGFRAQGQWRWPGWASERHGRPRRRRAVRAGAPADARVRWRQVAPTVAERMRARGAVARGRRRGRNRHRTASAGRARSGGLHRAVPRPCRRRHRAPHVGRHRGDLGQRLRPQRARWPAGRARRPARPAAVVPRA